MKRLKRLGALALACVMLLSVMPTAVSATEGFEENHCLIFATEPGETSDNVMYYKNGDEVSFGKMTWVDDGVHGKALSFNGKTDEYMEIGYDELRMSQMTFATWINFRGSADKNNKAAAYWQRLFTISAWDHECFFTVSPHAVEPAYTNNEGQLDGVFMEYYRGYDYDSGEEYAMRAFNGARSGASHFGLPQNEWHHMAVVVDNMSAKIFVDGNLIIDELFLMPIAQMSADSMMVGKGLWKDPILNALLDDTMMFDIALSEQQIEALMQTGDPVSITNPDAVTTTSTRYTPTTTGTEFDPMNVTELPEDKPYAPFGLPIWGFGVVSGLLALIIILTVIVNLYEANRRKQYSKDVPVVLSVDDEDDKPQISIKDAALQKRKEELERFLEEEQAAKEAEDHE